MKLWIAVVSFKAQILKYYAKSQKIWKNIQKGQKNVKKIWKTVGLWVHYGCPAEGMPGFFRGLAPGVLASGQGALQFAVYEGAALV